MQNQKEYFLKILMLLLMVNVITPEKESDVQDDQRFNTEKHHKQQHKF